MRNHSYNITITNISSGGHASADDAFNSGAINLETKIDAVDDYLMNDITFNEHNQLVVDRDELVLYAEGEAVGMRIFTDYIKGWRVDAANKPDWITLSPSSDATNVTKDVAITAIPIVVGSPSRSGEIVITAGPLKKSIKVTQKGDPGVTLTVSPSVLVFRKNPPGPQSVTVTSYPAALARMMSYVGSVTWAVGSHPVNDLNNLALDSYNFKPAVNNTGGELRGIISIVVELPTGETAMRSIEVVHLHTDAVFATTQDAAPWFDHGTIWVAKSSFGGTWHECNTHCANMGAGWRLATMPELRSMSPYKSAYNLPTHIPTWSSDLATPSRAWAYRFFYVSQEYPEGDERYPIGDATYAAGRCVKNK